MPRRKMVETVAGVAIQRAGFLKGRRGLLFAACWWIATNDLGRPPATVEEYVEWWGEKSRATAFRDQSAFRECFPEYSTPTDLAEAVGMDFVTLQRGREGSIVAELFSVAMP